MTSDTFAAFVLHRTRQGRPPLEWDLRTVPAKMRNHDAHPHLTNTMPCIKVCILNHRNVDSQQSGACHSISRANKIQDDGEEPCLLDYYQRLIQNEIIQITVLLHG